MGVPPTAGQGVVEGKGRGEGSRHCQGGYCLALLFLADQNTKHPANVAFQINSKGLLFFFFTISAYHVIIIVGTYLE